jgi:predicted transcriptional regulator
MAVDYMNPESLAALGVVIRKKRESVGWTQEKLAYEAGYSDKIIRLIEHGARTKLQTLQNVCQALGDCRPMHIRYLTTQLPTQSMARTI